MRRRQILSLIPPSDRLQIADRAGVAVARNLNRRGSIELGAPRRIGSRSRAGDCRHQACESEHARKLVRIEHEIRPQRVVIVQSGQDPGAKCIAGSDRVDHLDLRGCDPNGAG